MASYDTLGFSLSQLNEDSSAVNTYYNAYKNALQSLKENVELLSSKWTGDESGVVAAFQQHFNEKKPKLDEAEALMSQLNASLQQKTVEFEEATAAAKAAFM